MSNKVKTGIFIAGFTAFTLAALYPVVVFPKLHPEVYSKSRYFYSIGNVRFNSFFVPEVDYSIQLSHSLPSLKLSIFLQRAIAHEPTFLAVD